ncbi:MULTISPECIES: heme utilization cystosolic carrier protein HutX [Yersinia]|uniref:heme utilization cystosolic carrier protein HutX n=1 Tax=Yersinia TaxID=629 RepID=UPI0005E84772|nr:MULTISPECIES: heme utilization cystosolic carrier protein HutX [Yersinia]OVZ95740.1 heme utilization carrier protein [Yersinia frederiksenii]RXA94324.1 heme utilization cystosolic carrier protein HutX [Yersinia sp. 2105 StPb PI]CNI64361.1 putative heme iron utilization protein [Yersinia frederiksenii]CNJ25951.1 putative heme iron utilization protein [Yersinia frederiksenii]CNK65599.1 putative heme iron utilization protein [Yersinia frederiksenii]
MNTQSSNKTLPLTEFLATQPDGTLEQIAQDYQVSPLEVVRALPERVLVSADQFDRVWDNMTEWGEVTTLVHTTDIILEHKGPLPSGFHRHGYFNLRDKQGLSGHIRAQNCQAIALLERPFMGMATASVQFFNQQGDIMLKVYVGRDEHRQLRADGLAAFHQLAHQLRTEQQAISETTEETP